MRKQQGGNEQGCRLAITLFWEMKKHTIEYPCERPEAAIDFELGDDVTILRLRRRRGLEVDAVRFKLARCA
jgi:hypothetical protein